MYLIASGNTTRTGSSRTMESGQLSSEAVASRNTPVLSTIAPARDHMESRGPAARKSKSRAPAVAPKHPIPELTVRVGELALAKVRHVEATKNTDDCGSGCEARTAEDKERRGCDHRITANREA